eukprot:1703426-Alexandrium_andersonii.AAC.1
MVLAQGPLSPDEPTIAEKPATSVRNMRRTQHKWAYVGKSKIMHRYEHHAPNMHLCAHMPACLHMCTNSP